MIKSTIQVTLFSLLGIVINFIIQILLAYFFGASEERDAFFAATSVPTYINVIISGSFVVVFLPRLIDIGFRKEKDPGVFINNMITFSVVLLLIIVLPIVLFSKGIVSLLFHGFNTEKIDLTAKLLIVLSPTLIFQGLANILVAIYHSKKVFLKPSCSFLIAPVTTILVTYLFKSQWGIISVAAGSSAGWLFTFLYLRYKAGIRYKPNMSSLFQDRDFQLCLRQSMPLFLGSFIYRGSTVIEKMVASSFPAGVISYLGYASAIVTTLSSVTINGVATTMFPLLSEAWSARDMEKFRKFYSDSLKVIFILCVPIMLITIVFSKTIIAIVLERGAFNRQDTLEVSRLLALLMGGYFFLSINTIPGRLFYITGITRAGLISAIVEVVIYTVLCILLSRIFSYYGIAYAQIISVASATIFSWVILQVKFQVLQIGPLFRDMLKIAFCGFLSFLLMYSYRIWFDEQTFLIMLIFGGFAVVGYFFLLSLLLKDVARLRILIVSKIQNLIPAK
ncbi:lipid II flippase MurJ [Paraflavitalea sp. CAU 1676]|uniref:murein biosynthesis integral membrane protein MurJ n=1 Tax=Paraflavitalea sp. CAU 1676 TaxID=3032598 RepID=UPI0023DAEB85|nr:lipid II flippase MurJ [Paraflavitalea sp. CAU 1676]MDF2187453.1 lipid II flippase MurJ [Paraflavitalea sp. CAU 1676]